MTTESNDKVVKKLDNMHGEAKTDSDLIKEIPVRVQKPKKQDDDEMEDFGIEGEEDLNLIVDGDEDKYGL